MNRPDCPCPDAKAILGKYCSASETERYHQLLLQCVTAQEIAHKIIIPLYTAHHASEDTIRCESFYMALAKVADPEGVRIKRSTMYDNVKRVIRDSKQSLRMHRINYQIGRYNNGCDIRLLTHPDGMVELIAHLQFMTIDPQLTDALAPLLDYVRFCTDAQTGGHTKITPYIIKGPCVHYYI